MCRQYLFNISGSKLHTVEVGRKLAFIKSISSKKIYFVNRMGRGSLTFKTASYSINETLNDQNDRISASSCVYSVLGGRSRGGKVHCCV